jgi:ABC-2 type transport system permease protein
MTTADDRELGAAGAVGDDRPLVEWSRRPNPFQRIANVWRYRELLGNLVRKELKVKYKDSVLGFVWTLLNPMLYLVVFTLVFEYLLESQVEDFAIFFLSGLLAWNLFATALGGATGSIVGNASLVSKVWFPREILPLASIGASLVHFTFQATVLLGALVVVQRSPDWELLPLVPVALVVLLLVAAAFGVFLAAANVYLRDVQHLLELALTAWFWLSAIVYPFRLIADQLGDNSSLAFLNPVIPSVITFQKAIYNPADDTVPTYGGWWYLKILAITGAAAVVLLLAALHVFGRLEDDFSEEI